MAIDEKVEEEELIKISKKDCMSTIYQTLKLYNKEILKLSDAKRRIINFMQEAQLYEDLGFKVKYYFNNKNKDYTFSYEEKSRAGFKK